MRLFNLEITIGKAKKRSIESNGTSIAQGLGLLYNPGRTKAGITVNEETSLQLSAVWLAIRILSEGLASLPLGVYDKDPSRNLVYNSTHYLSRLIEREPSELYTKFTFIETMQALAVMRGNAYAAILRDSLYRPTELKILDPTYVAPYIGTDGLLRYLYKLPKADPVHIPYTEVLHIPGLSFNGLVGKGVLEVARENLALGLGAQDFGAKFYANGAHVDGVLTYPYALDDEQKKNLQSSFKAKHTGIANAGTIPLLEGGVDYKRIGLSPQDASFIESRKFSVEDVARWFNVPVYKLQALDRMTFNNVQQLAKEFVNQSLRPWAEKWEQEMSRKLFSEDEKRDPGRQKLILFDFAEMLRGDLKTTAESLNKLADKGFITINDGRRLLGMNTVNEAFADKHFIQLQNAPAENLVNNQPNEAKQ